MSDVGLKFLMSSVHTTLGLLYEIWASQIARQQQPKFQQMVGKFSFGRIHGLVLHLWLSSFGNFIASVMRKERA
jgi:hypothetical protein